jgi:hypothetical protein
MNLSGPGIDVKLKERRKERKKERLYGNYILKIGCHYFWPGLVTLPKNTSPNKLRVLILFHIN